jgi:hypothetical protein
VNYRSAHHALELEVETELPLEIEVEPELEPGFFNSHLNNTSSNVERGEPNPNSWLDEFCERHPGVI